jgi:hypothetical protein
MTLNKMTKLLVNNIQYLIVVGILDSSSEKKNLSSYDLFLLLHTIICCEGDGAASPGTVQSRIHRRCPSE